MNTPRLTLTRVGDNDADPFAFKNFLAHFEDAVGGNCDLSDEQRMIYLRAALDGRAFQLIQSLSVSADNYTAAMDHLRGEFFHLETLVDRTLDQMGKTLPIATPDYSGIKVYLGVIRSYVAELKNFGLDYLVDGFAPCVAMSRAIINKLPVEFRKVLIERVRFLL